MVQNIPFRTITSPNKTEDIISCYITQSVYAKAVDITVVIISYIQPQDQALCLDP